MKVYRLATLVVDRFFGPFLVKISFSIICYVVERSLKCVPNGEIFFSNGEIVFFFQMETRSVQIEPLT
jgi:hypothetical protein